MDNVNEMVEQVAFSVTDIKSIASVSSELNVVQEDKPSMPCCCCCASALIDAEE
jgi:hypothetical protein